MSVLKIKNAQGEWQEVPFIKGDKGDKGDTYELTEQDKEDIAGLVDIPIQIKYVKDDESDNGGVIEGSVTGDYANVASGNGSHAEGQGTLASGHYSHAEGAGNISSGSCSHAEGNHNKASGNYSHAEGSYSVASGNTSHAEGYSTASGSCSHAEGYSVEAVGSYSHAEGYNTIAGSKYQHVEGKYNIEDPNNTYAHIVGGGTSDINHKNIYTLDWQGNGVYAGKLTVGTAPTNDMDVATKKYVDDVKGASIHICSSEEYDSTTRIPTITNPDERTFYLVPSEDGTSPDLFVEWAYVNNAWEMFGSASIDLSGYLTDVQVNGISIVTDGVANVPIASSSKVGVVRTQGTYGLNVNEAGVIYTYGANSANIKAGTDIYRPINSSTQHEATFYGLAKASGDTTQSQSDNAVGIYTDEAKTSIQNMLGVPSIDDIPDVPVEDVQTNGVSVVADGVANIVFTRGISVNSNSGSVGINPASLANVKGGTDQYLPLTSEKASAAAFYGLAKASGDATQKVSSNAVGTYTPEAKGAIQSMLGIDSLIAPTETNPFSEAHAVGDLFIINGALYKAKTAIAINDVLDDGVNVEVVSIDDVAVKDVQINGTSIVVDGVASIPIGNNNIYGIMRSNTNYGTTTYHTDSGDFLGITFATPNEIKNPNTYAHAVVPYYQDQATFYGLAKASGDTTQSQSSNAVGTYTDEAKTSIKQMLGVVDSYDSLVVNVTGTDPVITGSPSYRYNCGEVASLTVTPPTTGTIDIIFTSGTTPTVLDLPNTVKMPSWWIGTEANTTYEICITDATYCGVMSWDV